jgi:hypothetical protein
MQWRRGIVFAAIHLAVGLAVVAQIEADEMTGLRSMHAAEPELVESPKAAAVSSGRAVDGAAFFDLCGMLDLFSPSETVLNFANPAPFLITGWRNPCAPAWSVSGMLVGADWPKPSFAQFEKERKVDAIFLLVVALQWLLIGGFPLRPHRGLWRDPATHVTACTVAAGVLSFVPNVESLSTAPMLYALAAWVWWFAFFVAKLFRSMLGFAKNWRLRHAEWAR